MNQVVARLANGCVVKGFTNDFAPDKAIFHVNVDGAAPDAMAVQLRTGDLKALYFVKDLAGDPSHVERKEFDPSRRPLGRKIQIHFKDGEEMVGTTQGYQPSRPGFFVIPADPESNMERCYIVSSATKNITFF